MATLNTAQLRKMNLKGALSFSYNDEISYLHIGETKLGFENWKDREATTKKLRKMGFDFNGNGYFATDEFAGLCQAGELGIDPFEGTTILSK